MTKVTAALLNWRRPDNLHQTIRSLRGQSLAPDVFVWNNGVVEDAIRQPPIRSGILQAHCFDANWQVDSSTNVGCMMRWWMAQQAEADVIMTCDDDLMPADRDVVADAVDELQRQDDPFRIVGAFGKALQPDKSYEFCRPIPNSEWTDSTPGEECDVVLGRMMFLRAESLRRIALPFADPDCFSTDDIAVSGLMAGGRPRQEHNPFRRAHWISAVFGGEKTTRLTELPANNALCLQPGHFKLREAARRRWFSFRGD